MQRLCVFLLGIFLLSTAALPAFGQITGSVRDSVTGEVLVGVAVSVEIEGADKITAGTTTDIDGNFSFNISPGEYLLKARYSGFPAKIIKGISIQEGQAVEVPILMAERLKKELNETTIVGSQNKDWISSLYTIQKNAMSISDGVSADVIKRSPDRNTGEVLKRVSGATIQDNRFIIVRGLNDRYNTALVDGASMPSTEANRKAFSFDIIPSGMIDNIVIYKSATPDLPGDFSGGLINVLTKEVPDQNFNSISIGSGFHTASTGKIFQSGFRGKTDFLGFAGQNRQLPTDFPNPQEIGKLNPYKPEGSTPYLMALNNDYSIKEHRALPPVSLQGSLGRIFYVNGNNRLGLTAALSYSHDENIKNNVLRQYDNFDYQDNIYTYSSNLGALLNLAYVSPKHKISLKTFYNRLFDDQLLYREGKNYSSSSMVKYYAFDLMQKSLFKTTLSAEHQIGNGGQKLDWLLSYNMISNNQPDQRKVSYSRSLNGSADYVADITTLGKANNRLFSDLNESVWNGNVNDYIPISIFFKSAIKVGVFGQYRYRDFHNRYLGATLSPNYANAESLRKLPINQLFDNNTLSQNAYILEDQTGDADTYTATVTNIGGYAMMDNKITEKFRAVWGARLENEQLSVATGTETVAEKKWLDVLPSLNLTYALNDRANLRASYFRSIARPELRELTNLSYYDYEMSATMTGDPALERTQIDNIDLRYEWFPGRGEIISASLFYKHFKNAIESRVYGANSSYDITPFNSPSAMDAGIEFEVRKGLGFLDQSGIGKNLSVYLNAAYIYSKADAEGLYIRGEKMKNRPLSGQAPYSINTGLSYLSSDGKLNVNLLYNRIGQRLTLIGQDKMGIIYELPRNLLDFQISYALSRKSTLCLNVKDILNNPVTFYFDQNNDGHFNGTSFDNGVIKEQGDWIWQSYRPGRSFSLNYSYSF